VAHGEAALAAVAAEAGFADQAHMNRAVKALTERTPGVWRGSNRFKTRPEQRPSWGI
jgi:AraC-like DNA-binding protein